MPGCIHGIWFGGIAPGGIIIPGFLLDIHAAMVKEELARTLLRWNRWHSVVDSILQGINSWAKLCKSF